MNAQFSRPIIPIIASRVFEDSLTMPVWSRSIWFEFSLLAMFLVPLLLAAISDARTRLIPNLLIEALIVCRFMAAALYWVFLGGDAAAQAYSVHASFVDCLVAATLGIAADVAGAMASGLALLVPVIVLAILAFRARGRASFGGGDAKLIFCVGIWSGVSVGALAVAIGCICAVAHCVLRVLAMRAALDWHRVKRKRTYHGNIWHPSQRRTCSTREADSQGYGLYKAAEFGLGGDFVRESSACRNRLQILKQTFPFAPYLLIGVLVVIGAASAGGI